MSGNSPRGIQLPESLRRNMSTNNVMPIAAAIVVVIVFQVLNPAFLGYQGRIAIVYAMSYFLITALGLTLVIMMGSFDFSVVSVMKLSALICVIYFDEVGFLVVPITLGISLGIGFINGMLFAKLRVPSFMATLAMSVVIDGVALLISSGFLFMMDDAGYRGIAVTFIMGLPAIFYWAIGLWIIVTLVALVTPFGRRTYAIGGNPKAAALSGVNVDRHRVIVFMISSLLAGFSGVLYIAQQGGGSVQIGGQMLIPLFASVVAGGTALKGGVGGPHRTLLGVIIITWVQTGLLMLGTSRGLQTAVLGVIAIIMTLATTERSSSDQSVVK